MGGRHKTISGKRFFKYRQVSSKREADSIAKGLKESDRYFVRVQKDGDEWAIWCREKK